jgi:pimeloyl-ACP methyl ester carboxylesterase
MRIPRLCITAVALLMASGIDFAAAQTPPAGGSPPETSTEPRKPHTDHMVRHVSTVPANKGEKVKLFVRERDGTAGSAQRRAVLMLHGRSIPALAGLDLDHDHGQYSWAGDLARVGFDVFVMDLQGSGRSPRPKMDDACNANPLQQELLIPHPLRAPCPPNYPYQLNNSQSDWDELDTVVEYIRRQRGVQKVALIGWSAAAFQIGPYTLQHPEKVESVLLLAPVFPPNGRASKPGTRFDAPVPLPVSTPAAIFGFPMNIGTPDAFKNQWDSEQHCPRQRDAGIVDAVWKAIMANDEFGSGWGTAKPGELQGVMRIRNSFWWGWNSATVPLDGILGGAVPVLIVYGDLDTQANTAPDLGLLHFSVPALYKAIPGPNKLMIRVACAGHSMVWERQYKVLHRMSRQWIRHRVVDGLTSGSFFLNEDGVYTNTTD